MTDKVTSLTEKLSGPDAEVVAFLEDALELAKKGEMREVVIFGSLAGGDMYRAATFNDGTALTGALMKMIFSIERGQDSGGAS